MLKNNQLNPILGGRGGRAEGGGIKFIKSEPQYIFSPNFLTFNFYVSKILMDN